MSEPKPIYNVRKPGRPALSDTEPTVKTAITLTRSQMRYAKDLGGSVSSGVQIAIDAHRGVRPTKPLPARYLRKTTGNVCGSCGAKVASKRWPFRIRGVSAYRPDELRPRLLCPGCWKLAERGELD